MIDPADKNISLKKDKKPNRLRASVSFGWLLPNLLTISALVCGMSAIRYALIDRFEVAVLLVALGGVFDALDGRMARLLKTSSNFGAQLDSLADMVVFGVVPPIILYLFALDEGGRLAWGACLFYTSCCALRLARFNSEIYDAAPRNANYFTGVPSPAAAFLLLLPLIASFRDNNLVDVSIYVLAIWAVVVGVLAISTLPTFSGKGLRLPRAVALPILGFFALLIAALIARPWDALLGIGIIYILSLPISALIFYRKKHSG